MLVHPSPNSGLTERELRDMEALMYDFRHRFQDRSRPSGPATSRLNTARTPETQFRRLSHLEQYFLLMKTFCAKPLASSTGQVSPRPGPGSADRPLV